MKTNSTLNKRTDINNFAYFSMNYDHDFIEECWKDDKHMAEHFRSKFTGYYKEYGCMGVMFAFYCGMSESHQQTLETYILNTFKG